MIRGAAIRDDSRVKGGSNTITTVATPKFHQPKTIATSDSLFGLCSRRCCVCDFYRRLKDGLESVGGLGDDSNFAAHAWFDATTAERGYLWAQGDFPKNRPATWPVASGTLKNHILIIYGYFGTEHLAHISIYALLSQNNIIECTKPKHKSDVLK